MNISNSLGYTLHHLSFILDRQSELFLQDRFGIGFSQFKILIALMKHTGVQQKEIAEFLGQTEASVSRQIQTMMDDGLVNSKRDPQNRRQRITQLSKKGEKLARDAMAELEKHYAPMFDTLTDKQQRDLSQMLDKLRDYVSSNVRYGYWSRARHRPND